MNLINSPCYPFRALDGSLRWASLMDLLGPVSLLLNSTALFDPLLDEAAFELFAAIFWLAFRPATEAEWREHYKANGATLSPVRLRALESHFDLFADARAFQDSGVANRPEQPIAGLFHASPGDQTFERNQDIGTQGPRGLSPGAAAVALYAMQAHAHAGGPSFRTSVAGGGPLRTVPRMGDTFFRQIWALVLPRAQFEQGMDAEQTALPDKAALPWVISPGPKPLAATCHPLLPLFATPRRILLSPPTTTGQCDLTGVIGPLVTHFREAQHGSEYSAGGFTHPWTPWRKETGKVSLPILAGSRPASFGWRDWAGYVAKRTFPDKRQIVPAEAVSAWTSNRLRAVAGANARLQLTAYGVRCEKAKVLGFVRATHVFDIVADEYAADFQGTMEAMIKAVETASNWLTGAVREVVNDGSKDRKDPVERQARGRSDVLWDALEEAGARFSHDLAEAFSAGKTDRSALRAALHDATCAAVKDIFDAATGDAILQPDSAKKAAQARGRLLGSLWGRPGRDLFGLPDIPPKDSKKSQEATP